MQVVRRQVPVGSDRASWWLSALRIHDQRNLRWAVVGFPKGAAAACEEMPLQLSLACKIRCLSSSRRRVPDAAAPHEPCLGKSRALAFDDQVINSLKLGVKEMLEARGMSVVQGPADRGEVYVDCRFMQLLLTAAEISIARLPALYKAKENGAFLSSNYSFVAELTR